MNLIYGVIGTYALSNSSVSSLAKKQFFRKPTRPSLPLRKAPPLISVFSPQRRRGKPPLVLTFLPLRLSCKESSTSNQAFLLRRKDVTALRCSEPLRSMDGGPSKVFAMLCGMGPHGDDWLQFISRLFAGKLLISFDFLGGFEEKVYFWKVI